MDPECLADMDEIDTRHREIVELAAGVIAAALM